eukprot:1874315-Pleurochrysis_carterae.AAC.1
MWASDPISARKRGGIAQTNRLSTFGVAVIVVVGKILGRKVVKRLSLPLGQGRTSLVALHLKA